MIVSYIMKRVRLTITLQKDLLNAVDTYIDGVSIRNRSHAIEALLSRETHPQIKKAVILAADEGITFRPFTYEMPKAMLPIKGRPLLEYVITQLRLHDIRELYITVGYLSEKIISYFGNGSKFGISINYISQNKKDVGTGGALLACAKFLKANEPFFLIYGDVLADINYQDMAKFYYRRKNAFGVVALTTVAHPELWGVVKIKGHNIVEFDEKPIKTKTQSHLISSGIYLFTPEIFSYIPKGGKTSIERDVLPKIVQAHKISGYIMEGKWYDISTPAIYAQVLKTWKI